MHVNTGDSSAGRPAEVVVELTEAEAVTGAPKTIATPPDGTPVTIYFPPGARDGLVVNVDVPVVDPATGTTSTRPVAVAIRVLPGGPVPGVPVSGGPVPGFPVSGGPVSGGPVSGGPVSGGPVPGFPVSGGPVSGGPVPGGHPQYGPPAPPGYPQPGYQQPGYQQPGYPPQPGYPQPGFPPPGFAGATPAPSRFGTRAKVVAGALGVLLIGGLCLVPTLFRDSKAETTGGTGTTTSTTDSGTTTTPPTEQAAAPTTPPLDPAAFQAALSASDGKLSAAVKSLYQATSPKAVATAADALAGTIRTESSNLSGLTAPDGAGSAHRDLVSALDGMERELSAVTSAAESREVCTGGAASASLSRAGAAADLRSAITALGAADPAAKYRFGAWLQGVTKDQNRRKPNATYLSRTTGGSGQLKVDNGNSTDTVVNLVKPGTRKPAVSVYIHGRQKVTTSRIKDGTYQIFIASGSDWDGKRFTRNCSFSKFDDSFAFRTTSRQFTIWEISLKETLGGNASSSDVDPDAFPS
ncbi:hypothetical protein [Actinoplanes utahensis]|uniref:Uncharacterized protein n=1 Tax=Actinoplanes utahensis TaxID=1869 RepID=A0A0A6UGV9_ACTUT|nr:hypothetical protein [Actinoplanes utahensis]KHD74283.1 hypothetical protein MB27_29690 [Actinoplanes utahensis]